MADPIFHSKFSHSIENFIYQKRTAGYPYLSSAKILGYLDSMITECFPDSEVLTKEICDKWIDQSSKDHQNTLLRRITPVRQFAKYLVGSGKAAYIIPGKIPNKQIRYDAHIYTETELIAFFNAIDNCPKSSFSPWRRYIIPVFFRLLFTCGLRSSEARFLKRNDIDLCTGKIVIRKSKGWKARMIYVDDELLDLFVRYDAVISKAFPEREAFFPNQKGSYYNKSTPSVWFHEFWDPLPEASEAKGNPPRIHDFRHTYAVYRLNRWVYDHKELNAFYPYLSEYLGHSNFVDTDYYLTLAEPFYPEFNQRMGQVNAQILPEVPHEDV